MSSHLHGRKSAFLCPYQPSVSYTFNVGNHKPFLCHPIYYVVYPWISRPHWMRKGLPCFWKIKTIARVLPSMENKHGTFKYRNRFFVIISSTRNEFLWRFETLKTSLCIALGSNVGFRLNGYKNSRAAEMDTESRISCLEEGHGNHLLKKAWIFFPSQNERKMKKEVETRIFYLSVTLTQIWLACLTEGQIMF